MYISYSSALIFKDCPFKFKLQYVDKIPFPKGSIHTAFGDAIHVTNKILLENKNSNLNISDIFKENFKKSLKNLDFSLKKEIVNDKKLKILAKEMFDCGATLSELSINQLYKKFPLFEIVAAEGKIIEPIVEYTKSDFEFKGILDLVIKTPDNNIHIIDWKTTSWGWDYKKRSDTWVNYQLAFYKHYLTQQMDYDSEHVQTYFALIKRTCKNSDEKIEFIETKIGKKKINNALKVLNNMVYNVDHKNFPKNKTSCTYCPFKKTKWCP